jgi:hypothetical protein
MYSQLTESVLSMTNIGVVQSKLRWLPSKDAEWNAEGRHVSAIDVLTEVHDVPEL